jgi:hypothetical protein
MRRFGRREIDGSLEYNKGVTVKAVNLEIKDLGFQMYFNGYDEWGFPWYGFRPLGRVTHRLKTPTVICYAIGDYTIAEWKGVLLKLLKETDPRYETAALNRQRRKRRRRETKDDTSF